MHILIAPNAFKNSLTAEAVADAIAVGLCDRRLDCSYECFPVGDGGDGTAGLLLAKCGGRTIPLELHDPLGRKISASIGLIDAICSAVIELADASGLRLLRLDERDPLRATTFGVGEAIKKALDLNVRRIVLGVGGSATVDGAVGLLQALGVRFHDAAGQPLSPLPCALVDLETIDLAGMDPRLSQCDITLMCDVDNPILGEHGSAAVFGPQKGATPADIKTLEAALTRLCAVLYRQTGRDIARTPHGGAAGGVAAVWHGLLEAKLVNGVDYFLDATGFDASLQRADLVITGEGSIDEQTLHGKAPYGVAVRAKAKGIPVVALAGRVPLERNSHLERCFDVLLPIGAGPTKVSKALGDTALNLRRTAQQLGNLLALRENK